MPKRNKFLTSGVGGFVFSLLFSTLIIILLTLIFACVANSSSNPSGNLGIYSLISMLLSAAVGGYATGRINKSRGIALSLLTAGSVISVMILVCLISSGGKIPIGAFMNYGCYFGVFALSDLLARRASGKRHKRHK